MSLAESQSAFAHALFAHDATPATPPLFKGDAALNAQRLALYRGNLAAAWDKALANAYPVLRQLVGEEFFAALAREYGRAFPSQSGDLNRFGDRFDEFLAQFPHVADFPCFPDMARLEWLLHRVHYAAGEETLTAAQLAQLRPEQFESMSLRLQPACQPFASPWAVTSIWQAHQDDEQEHWPQELAVACHALVLRQGWRAMVLPVTPAAHAALAAFDAGAAMGKALDAALAIDAQFDIGMHLQTWLRLGVFAAQSSLDQAE